MALHPDTAAAVLVSARRAESWVREALRERAILPLTQGRPWADGTTFALSSSKTDAINVFRHFARVRFHKYHRARLRRYQRLRHLYELQHPPFSSPEFPEHPSMTVWCAPIELQSHGWQPPTTVAPKEPSDLTEDDDEISPVLTTISLPPDSLPLT
ncbi:hypothetical protein C8R47DRAFT_1218361 [Mycena vitilis]|nr:hypothetical protein C8R47DRAFT_1218361 [Mycena vitilis]